MEKQSTRLAVLIDAENVSAQIADGLFTQIARIGEASVRRIYGDFSGPRLAPWTAALARHAIRPHQQFACVTGKNASDIALVIDAMDLLHQGDIGGFCIVSSDSDFTSLAIRIREAGVTVFGFGKRSTANAFQQACDQFFPLEGYMPAVQAKAVAPVLIKPPPPAVKPAPAKPSMPAPAKLPPAQAIELLKRAFSKTTSRDGWVDVGPLGSILAKEVPGFDARQYGAKKLSDLVRQSNIFDVTKAGGNTMRIRLKTAQK